MMLQMVLLELKKLKGTLVVPLCLAVPTIVAIAMGLICIRQPLSTWKDTMHGGIGLWAYFMLPMAMTALCALMANIEHRGNMWDHLLALPILRWRVFFAKAFVTMLTVGAMSLILALEIRAVGSLIGWLMPSKSPTGEFPWHAMIEGLSAMWAASFFFCMLQLWVALSYRNFVVSLVMGLCGTFVTVVAVGARESVFIPWVMPVSVLVGDGVRLTQALALGVGGGVITLALMVWHLSRQEA
jgi:lantibiotic transport system permease protein